MSISDRKMGFFGRITNTEGKKPFILYLHEFGVENFGFNGREKLLNARNNLVDIINQDEERFKASQYLIATFWSNQGAKMADIFGFGSDYKEWPGNPEVFAWVYKNGVYNSTPNITCSESLQMLGKEVECRRKSNNIIFYFAYRPDLGDLQPKHEPLIF